MSHDIYNRGPIYTAAFASSALSTAAPHDFFGILPPSNSRVIIHEIVIGAALSTEAGALDLGVRLLRGSTASSTSAAITPNHIHGWSGAPTAGSVVTGPSTTLTSTASAVLLYADSFRTNHWSYKPKPWDRPILEVSQRLHVRITTPAVPTLFGTIVFAEIGRPASS